MFTALKRQIIEDTATCHILWIHLQDHRSSSRHGKECLVRVPDTCVVGSGMDSPICRQEDRSYRHPIAMHYLWPPTHQFCPTCLLYSV